ncbi:streptogrisin C [Nonomuraea thailandensis]|uniref:Streptogrisin C n=1 Tax=Nonomuraea thailandensis TaxID=1188745 RepID=A0A9X2GKM2_9ACTN|nr:S1 family peptidase [Nonomuraea thailandensis]MCP2359957.1 streptogrisin C [Nonomuraea thailandensis]
MLRTPALIGIAIGALLVTTTPAAATAKPPSGVVDALQRDLGITKDQAINRLANEARGNAAAPGLSKKLGDRFAGIWYEGAESALVVATTSAADTAGITRAGVRARVVPRSLAQLVTLKEGLDRAAPPASVHSWAVSPQSNSVVVLTSDEQAARAWVATSGISDPAAVTFEASAERPRLFYDIRGGDAYYTSEGYRCSIGFATRRGTQLGFTTAGHCGGTGVTTTGYNRVAQGTFQISSFPGNDYAWVATNTNWTAPGVVNGYSAGILPVRGAAVTQPQGSICRSGSTTQWHCGTVQALNSTVNYPEGTVSGLTRTNVCAEGGDSGGSFISGDQAQGMTSGGSGNCSVGGTTYFQPLGEILSAGGLTLVTSGGTDPPPTGCQGYEETYSGSLTSNQSVYQPNGSYYQTTVSGTHAACLDGPSGVDFDVYLQRWNGSSWAVVARGDSPNPDESITYNGAAGYYRYRVHAYSGAGSYTLGLNRP